MPNSIDITINSGNNTMNSLKFFWIALFKDGSKIEQFNEDGTENKFQSIKDRFDDLAYFNLTDRKGHFFSVDLTQGIIGYNKLEFPYIKSNIIKYNIRLIYFRRHRVILGTQNLEEKKHAVTYFLGIQYLDKRWNNKQIILQIDDEGNFIIEE